MAEKVQGLNPEILIWARERAGRSIDDVAKALGRQPKTIVAWEAGEDAPTYAQLEKLAYAQYKRPIALFFFPAPPVEPDPHQAFRTLPEFEIDTLSPTTRFRIRQAQSFQLSLRELSAEGNPSDQLIFRDIRARSTDSTANVANQVRTYLGITLDHQTSNWRDTDDALKGWRDALENAGVFIFKDAFRQDDVSGFCLYDPTFPVICVNNSITANRQIFTYFHELAHILLSTNGVTKLKDRYIASLSGENKRIEVFCNRFAADFLLPLDALRELIKTADPKDDNFIGSVARKFKVSREAVLRRFLDEGKVSRTHYLAKARQWRDEAKTARQRQRESGGGNYYNTHATYLGANYMRLAFQRYYEGAISLEQLADHLNVNPRTVPGLEEQVLKAAG